MVKIRRIAVSLFLWTLGASGAFAATWVLANGDRLNGTLVNETDGAIEIEHPQLGRMKIPRTALQGTVVDSDGAKSKVGSTGLTPTANSTIKVATRPQWVRKLELGFVMQEGAKSQQDLSVRAEIEGRMGSNSYRGTARVLRSESEGVVTRSREEADFRWRRDFNRRTFAQALTTYASDDVRKIDLSLEQQFGGGYRIVDGERQKMNIGVGAVLQRLMREDYDDYTALLGSAFQDYAFSWNDRLKLTQESSVQFADQGTFATQGGRTTFANAPAGGNYRVKFNAALQSKMSSQVSLNLRYEYDYDRSIPERVLRADSRLTTSLGYAW